MTAPGVGTGAPGAVGAGESWRNPIERDPIRGVRAIHPVRPRRATRAGEGVWKS